METLTDTEFDGRRLRRSGTWAVAFLADWCPFCARFRPGFEGLGRDGSRSVAVADVSDEGSPLWDRFGIDVVPTVLIFRDGSVTERFDGRYGRGLGPPDLDRIRSALHDGPSVGPRAHGTAAARPGSP